MLVNILIIFFIILIFYQIFLSHAIFKINDDTIEGLDTMPSQQYQPYDMNNPNNALILAQQNAGNIQVLKQQLDKLVGLDKEVQDISGNMVTLTSQVTKLMESQQQIAKSALPDSPPEITGST